MISIDTAAFVVSSWLSQVRSMPARSASSSCDRSSALRRLSTFLARIRRSSIARRRWDCRVFHHGVSSTKRGLPSGKHLVGTRVSQADPANKPEVSKTTGWSVEVTALYRTYASWLTAFLARRFGREIAEDLAQETFLRLAQHPLDWRSPKALLARIALNVGQDHLRREKAQKRPRLVTGDDLPEGVSPPDQHETLLHREVVAKLPRNLRDVYVLSRFGGMTYAEIATHLGISVKAVEKRMTQALRLCMARYRG
ncbi:hypothetical protein DJ019_09065 [Phenylobacterium kunshanense]|uniref:RNA polymerase subunit sigma-70 n=1 Tax=Phenylobacterium kunshanense TaxID=1445034 RepID=A0A328BK61_9CAUL|nr:hypothetical protein DJ019_09065 [Phenylobacterium kunshanense]